jgi:2TM domain-containing protein
MTVCGNDVKDPIEEKAAPGDDRRGRAIVRLRKKSEFRAHLLAFFVVNGAVVIAWAVTGGGFFWPIFLILAWGVGLIFHARDVYRGDEPTEEQIRREMERLP